MKINLRFGMHRDIEIIHQAQSLLDGLVIPAHILAHQVASTAAFVCSLPKHNYVIDPMTWMLRGSRERHRRGDGTLRPSIAKWCNNIHIDLSERLLSGHAGPLSHLELPDLEECCRGNFQFQAESVNLGHVDPRTKKYLKRYGTTSATTPRCVLPPYYQFDRVDDAWYQATIEGARITQTLSTEIPVAPVIMCNSSILDNATTKRIAGDFGSFEKCFVWIESLVQGGTKSVEVKRVRELVRALNSKGCKVETLYGGFMLMLMERDGMVAVSHGILYTQDRAGEQVPGGGSPPERYYIPSLHDFRSLSQANLILKRHPELVGGTPTSDSIMAGDPDRIFLFASRPEALRQHFLEARRWECDLLASTPLPEIISGLRATYHKYHDSVSRLPNPDAVMKGGDQKGLDYLLAWADGFS